MKKTLNSILLVGLMLIFSGCGGGDSANDPEKNAEIQKEIAELKAKVAILKDEQDGVVKSEVKSEVKTEVEVKTEAKSELSNETKTVVKVENKNSIIIESPKDKETVTKEPVVFSGTVSEGATKIVVTSSADGEPYALQTFKSGSTKFSYKAGLKFKNLKVGANTFDFVVTFKDGTTKNSKVKINFSK